MKWTKNELVCSSLRREKNKKTGCYPLWNMRGVKYKKCLAWREMRMFHKDLLNISFQHQYKIKKAFGQILGIKGIGHFSLDLVRPDSEMIFFSGTPAHAYEICKHGYGEYDGIISPDYYQNYEFYWWKEAHHKAFADKITEIRENVLGLKHGFMLVRKWNNFHLIYSFATTSCDPHFQSMVINNLNTFLKMGDFAFMEMFDVYCEYTGQYEPPEIENFYAFEGGKPPSRYTKNYKHTDESALILPHDKSNIVYVNFKNNIAYQS